MRNSMRLPGTEHLSDAEYEEVKAREKEKYRNKMNMVCPSKEIRFAAKEITMTDSKCEMCVYHSLRHYDGCRIPHTTAYIEAVDLDVCYEGVLLFLSQQLECQKEDSNITLEEVDNLLESACSTIYVNLKTIAALCGVIIEIAKQKRTISLELTNNMYALLDATQEMIENWQYDSIDDFDNNNENDDDSLYDIENNYYEDY